MNHHHRIVAGALTAAGVLAALAPTANAGNVKLDAGILRYTDKSAANNTLLVQPVTGKPRSVLVHDSAGLFDVVSSGCVRLSDVQAECPNVNFIDLKTGAGNEQVVIQAPTPGAVDLGDGDDHVTSLTGGVPNALGVQYLGGNGTDTMRYSSDQGVDVSLDRQKNDGVAGAQDNVMSDFERLHGTQHDDVLRGDDDADTLLGGFGNDVLIGNGGPDLFDEGNVANGSDRFFGGAGFDTVGYGLRTQPVRGSIDNLSEDGQGGERDNIVTDVEGVFGGTANDELFGSAGQNELNGGAGDDLIRGFGGNDFLKGHAGFDTLEGGDGVDTLHAIDGARDTAVACGAGTDIAHVDPNDRPAACEGVSRASVGEVKLSPQTIDARPGRVTELSLSWTHPAAWRHLDEVGIDLVAGGRKVGRVVIDQETGKITATGVEATVAGGAAALKPRVDTAKELNVKLRVRIPKKLAGRVLDANVGAKDDDGTRQAARRAARIRVAG